MKRSIQQLRLTLIQVREAAKIAAHEQTCFLERLAISPENLTTINVIEAPDISWKQVANSDAVIIGGAAAHSALDDDPFTEPLMDVVRRLVDEDHPLFGSCWGHQFIARALGGELVTDRENEEIGTFDLHLTDAGCADPLFAEFPPSFAAHMGHHDRIDRLPDGAIELAYSKLCRHQVFRLDGKPVYGTQFHAEMSAARLVERLSFYRDSYMPSDEEFETLKKNPTPTPDADRILHCFLEQVA